MSIRRCSLDRLPVELVHIVFTYFNRIFYAYSNFHWHLRSEQVVSLTLSDDEDAPGQSELRPSQRVESVALIL